VTRFVLAAVPTVQAGVWSGTTAANGYVTVPLPAPPAGKGWSVTVSGYTVLFAAATTAMDVMLDALTANWFRVLCRQPLTSDPLGNVHVWIHWQAVAYTP
jgi:hypothetical protein